jgi:hypothetical protein
MEMSAQLYLPSALPPGKTLEPIKQEAAWALETAWTVLVKRKSLAPAVFEPRTCEDYVLERYGLKYVTLSADPIF